MLSTHIQMAAAVFFVAAIHLTHAAEFQWIRNTAESPHVTRPPACWLFSTSSLDQEQQ